MYLIKISLHVVWFHPGNSICSGPSHSRTRPETLISAQARVSHLFNILRSHITKSILLMCRDAKSSINIGSVFVVVVVVTFLWAVFKNLCQDGNKSSSSSRNQHSRISSRSVNSDGPREQGRGSFTRD